MFLIILSFSACAKKFISGPTIKISNEYSVGSMVLPVSCVENDNATHLTLIIPKNGLIIDYTNINLGK
jgi:hypothetical protein